jgi:TetR/AcrR family fatty acid metabolism transcriptional regulator
MESNPNYARILMMAQRENPEFYDSEHVLFLKDYSKLVLKVIIDGQEENFFRPELDPRLIRNMAMGASFFTVYDSLIQGYRFDPHETSDQIYQLVLNGTKAADRPGENRGASPKRAEIRRFQIIETSTRVISAKGYSNATISEIAKQAHLGDATLYEYFSSKEAILLGIPEVYMKDLITKEDIRFIGLPEQELRLRKLIWRWIWKLYSNEEFSKVLVLELWRNVKFYESPGYEFIRSYLSLVRETVEQGQSEGVFIEEVTFPLYFHMILGTFDQYLLSQFLINTPPLGLFELNRIVDALVRAIKVSN